jgi:hypothetical protein
MPEWKWFFLRKSPEGKKYFVKRKVKSPKKPKGKVLYEAKPIVGTTQAGIIGEKLDEKE